jgi:uncharacterized membrane protein
MSPNKPIKTKKVTHPRITALEQSFSGPIPPPAILAGYEKALPGSADRIITLAEKQAAHRQGSEMAGLQSRIKNERLGMNYAFILSLAVMGAGVYLLSKDKDTVGLFALFGPSVFQAGSYIYFKSQSNTKK